MEQYRNEDIIEFGPPVNLTYKVGTNFLFNLYQPNNGEIFTALKIKDKEEFCSKVYGYRSMSGGFPQYKPEDYAAASRVIHALKQECEKLNSESSTEVKEKPALNLDMSYEDFKRLTQEERVEIAEYVLKTKFSDIERGDSYMGLNKRLYIAKKKPSICCSGNYSIYIDCGINYLWSPEVYGVNVFGSKVQVESGTVSLTSPSPKIQISEEIFVPVEQEQVIAKKKVTSPFHEELVFLRSKY